MVLVGVHRLERHGVDGVGSNQCFGDIHGIRIVGILGRCGRPKWALSAAASLGQLQPLIGSEPLEEEAVGGAGVGDRRLAPKRGASVPPSPRAAGSTSVSIRETKKEATELTVLSFPPAAREFGQTVLISLDHLGIAGKRKDQGDVDRNTLGGKPPDGFDPGDWWREPLQEGWAGRSA